MPIIDRALDRLADLIWTGRKVPLHFTAEYRTACFAAPLITKLLADNEDGAAYRIALIPWHLAERPPLATYSGYVSRCQIDGPVQWANDRPVPLGGLIDCAGVTARLNPFEAAALHERMQQANEAAIRAWARENDLYSRPAASERFNRRSDDRAAKAMIAAWAKRQMAPEAPGASPANGGDCCPSQSADAPCNSCKKGPADD